MSGAVTLIKYLKQTVMILSIINLLYQKIFKFQISYPLFWFKIFEKYYIIINKDAKGCEY
jgi:hypothetical protein